MVYGKCGAVQEAENLFIGISKRNVISWTAMVSTCIEQGLGEKALQLYRTMQGESLNPDEVMLATAISACSILQEDLFVDRESTKTLSLHIGQAMHADARRMGLIKKTEICNALITLYGKCGTIEEAEHVFEDFLYPNLMSWNSMLSAYVRHGLGEKALLFYTYMLEESINPDKVSLVIVLQACNILEKHLNFDTTNGRSADTISLEIIKALHSDASEMGLILDSIAGNAFVTMYGKSGTITEAEDVFYGISYDRISSWNAMISVYAQHGLGHEAIKCFKQMRDAGVSPNAVTYACILKSCGIVGCLETGKDIDAEVRKQGLLEKDVVIGTALVDMYSKCGALERAREVFEQLQVRNVVSWNALISGYVQHEQGEDALKCFRQMQITGVQPDAVTYVCVLKACAIVKALHIGEQIHNEVRKRGLLRNDVMLGTALVDMYSKCNALQKAQDVFESLPVRNVVSWNALITGHAQNGLVAKALECFRKMEDAGVCPNSVTYICILKACASSGSLEIGEGIHAQVEKQGLLHKDVVLGTILVNMFSKCGALEKATEVFEQLQLRDVVVWNALISGYVDRGLGNEALMFFQQMQDEGIRPDEVTYICILKACGIVGSLEIGDIIGAEVRKQGLLEKDVVLGTSLVDMYAKCGALEKAREVFEEIPNTNVVSLNALITGYVQHGLADEALKCFRQMQDKGVSPNAVTLICILKSCSSMEGIVDMNNQFQNEIVSKSLLRENIMLGNSLIDMFGKCGELAKAQNIFEELPVRDVISWNSLIAGYVGRGLCHEALNCLELMQNEGLSPSILTLIGILRVCGSTADIQKGKLIHSKFISKDLWEKNVVIGNALIDMYVECGVLGKAQEVLEKLLVRDVVSWSALISG